MIDLYDGEIRRLDFYLGEGDLEVGEHRFQILHTPGHSPGSVSVYWPERKALFTGDVLFPGGLGRTDLPGGNGAQLKESIRRLAELDAVQNTYLLIFQLLGGLGLLLGSVGLGMVVLRNTLERRSELALLGAVGFTRRAIRRVVLSEHALLLALGLASGSLAAMIALVPGLQSGAAPSTLPIVVILLAVTANGALWVVAATALALRGPLLAALRRE